MTVVEKTTSAIPAEGTWSADEKHSSATFAVRHAAGTFRGGFRGFEAKLEANDGDPRLTGRVAVENIDIDDEDIRPHLLAPDFFDVERTPKVSFTSTSIEADGDELVVRGELEIRGAKHEVTARGHATDVIEIPGGGERFGLELSTTIDRTDYGLDWNMELPNGGTVLGNEVELVASLELSREEK